VFVWLCGMCFSIYISIWHPEINMNQKPEPEHPEHPEVHEELCDVSASEVAVSDMESSAVLELKGTQVSFKPGQWPESSFSRPIALSCHSAYGRNLLMTERFVVHEIPVSAEQEMLPLQRSERIKWCLGQMPDFHAEGLASTSIECPSPQNCSAILLGRSGDAALLCPLNGTVSAPTMLDLSRHNGGQAWGALAAGQENSGRRVAPATRPEVRFDLCNRPRHLCRGLSD